MDKEKEASLNRIKDAFQPFYKEELTLEDAREIGTNIKALADLVSRWDEEKHKNN
jgi:hypothetical protein